MAGESRSCFCVGKRLRRPVLYRVKQEAVPTVTAEELEELLSDFRLSTCDSWLYCYANYLVSLPLRYLHINDVIIRVEHIASHSAREGIYRI